MEPSTVADALGLRGVRSARFSEGITLLDSSGPEVDRAVFVTPAIAGWTLAVGGVRAMPHAGHPDWVPFLDRLSSSLGHVQYFGTHRVVGYVAWARSENGRLIRAYAYSGESGETLVNLGRPTPEEEELGIDFLDERSATEEEIGAHERRRTELERAIDRYTLDRDPESLSESEMRIAQGLINKYDMTVPNETSVTLVAGRWSIDPTQLGERGGAAARGLLGWREPMDT
jgi:hypothetical protein